MKRGSFGELREGKATPVSSPQGSTRGDGGAAEAEALGCQTESRMPPAGGRGSWQGRCSSWGRPETTASLSTGRTEVLCEAPTRAGARPMREGGPGCRWPCGAMGPVPASGLAATGSAPASKRITQPSPTSGASSPAPAGTGPRGSCGF